MKLNFLIVVCLLAPGTLRAKEKPPTVYTIPLPAKPDFASLQWLVGEWVGKTSGRSPEGEIRLAIDYALDNRFLVLREDISLAATKTAPAIRESWMGILSEDRAGAGFLLRAFSSTGFITRYRVTVEGSEVHFNPEGGEQPPPGWLFRRVIQRSGDDELKETVQAAPPNKSFFDYYSAKLTRATHP